jgi:hypothetical protein
MSFIIQVKRSDTMEHSDFLKPLKTLKSRLKKPKKTTRIFPTEDSDEDNSYCTCKDSSGEFKYLYTSQDEIDYILSSKSISLKVYPCPYEKGWHLTKK